MFFLNTVYISVTQFSKQYSMHTYTRHVFVKKNAVKEHTMIWEEMAYNSQGKCTNLTNSYQTNTHCTIMLIGTNACGWQNATKVTTRHFSFSRHHFIIKCHTSKWHTQCLHLKNKVFRRAQNMNPVISHCVQHHKTMQKKTVSCRYWQINYAYCIHQENFPRHPQPQPLTITDRSVLVTTTRHY